MFTSLGNFIPSIYLPGLYSLCITPLFSLMNVCDAAYAADLGLKTSDGTMLVAVMNGERHP